MTALHIACKRNNLTAVKALLENGANPNISDKYGKKPIDYTIEPVIAGYLTLKEVALLKEEGLPSYGEIIKTSHYLHIFKAFLREFYILVVYKMKIIVL